MSTPFKIIVDTTKAGSANTHFILPLDGSSTYNFDVDWGDGGAVQTVTTNTPIDHTMLGGAGTYTITITENVVGGFPHIYFNDSGDKLKLMQISQWGTNKWLSLGRTFRGCSNLTITATDEATANTGSVTNFSWAWADCSGLTSFPLIDTSGATTLSSAWYGTRCTSFPLIDTSNVTDFSSAWRNCNSLTSFPLIDTSKATTLYYTWSSAGAMTSFPLINTGNCTNFEGTWQFLSLTSFPLIDTSKATTLFSTWGGNSFSSFPLINTSNVTDFSNAWRNCQLLVSFPLIDTSKGTNFYYTWSGSFSLFTFPTLNMRAITNGEGCFNGVKLGVASYSALITDMALGITTGVVFNGGTSKYAPAVLTAHNTLTVTRSWTITDGGMLNTLYEVGSGKPYSTIQSALDSLYSDYGSGTFLDTMTIRVYTGTYTETATPNSALKPTATYRLMIEAAAGNTPVIDGQSTRGDGVLVIGIDYVTVDGFTVHHCTSEGIFFYNGADYCTASNNICYSNNSYGILWYSGCTYGIAHHNISYSNGAHGIVLYDTCNYGTVYNNLCYSNGTAGIYFRISTNMVAYNNHCHHCTFCFDIEDGTIAKIYNNLSHDSTNPAFGLTILSNSYVELYNNTLYLSVLYIGNSSNATVKNNLMTTSAGYCITVNDAASKVGFVSDYNDCHISGTAKTGKWGAVDENTLADWQLATSQDSHSIDTHPALVNEGGTVATDYQLTSVSPCINIGVSLSSIFSTDYFNVGRPQGIAWDIGFNEYVSGTLLLFNQDELE